MPERSHLSIGEVLSLLREEFPDVTISKIRFLESQGLVDPERTPSGYRKFYDPDVERLRWILRQQRENFLPLKVIRGRLSEQDRPDPDQEGSTEEAGQGTGQPEPQATNGGDESDHGESAPLEPAEAGPAISGHTGTANSTGDPTRRAAVGEPSRPVRIAPPVPSLFAGLHPEARPEAHPEARPEEPPPVPGMAGEGRPGPTRPPSPVPRFPRAAEPAEPRSNGAEADTFTTDELAAAIGAEPALVEDLKQYGLISPHAMVAGTAYYDESALAVARCAAEFSRHGVEARHLRIWRNAADREADLFQQIVLPLLRQRNPQARRQALDTLDELARVGRDLRTALVDRALREIR